MAVPIISIAERQSRTIHVSKMFACFCITKSMTFLKSMNLLQSLRRRRVQEYQGTETVVRSRLSQQRTLTTTFTNVRRENVLMERSYILINI